MIDYYFWIFFSPNIHLARQFLYKRFVSRRQAASIQIYPSTTKVQIGEQWNRIWFYRLCAHENRPPLSRKTRVAACARKNPLASCQIDSLFACRPTKTSTSLECPCTECQIETFPSRAAKISPSQCRPLSSWALFCFK